MKNRTQAFTLIELLIVVAIIAILAAIAVPNFLEAQTRSKVSRVASDMRTIATAVEAYAVDNNTYPYSESVGGALFMVPEGYPRLNAVERPGGLTTPIAYMTDVPQDAFKHPLDSGSGLTFTEGPYYYERAGFGYLDGTKTTAMAVLVPADAVGNGRMEGIGPDTAVTDPALTPARWLLFSVGPSQTLHVVDENGVTISMSRYNLGNRYDPTNGTVSMGNVFRIPSRAFPG